MTQSASGVAPPGTAADGPLPRGCARPLRRAALAVGLLFPVLGLGFRLDLFADGALFSYGVAACDAWAFHFRHIPTRLSAYLLTVLPGQVLGCLSGQPGLGLAAHALLFFAAPLLGLLATGAADRDGRVLPWAALALLAFSPLAFGFPSELWVALAAAWPAMALSRATGGWPRRGATVLAFAILACGHEAGLLTAFVILAALALGRDRPALRRAGAALLPAVLLWVGLKLSIRPDAYLAPVMARVTWTFVEPGLVLSPTILFPLVVPAALAAGFLAFRRWVPALLLALAVAALFWLLAGIPVHGSARYYARTMLFAGNAALLLAAGLDAAGRLPAPSLPPAERQRLVLGAVALCLALHAVQLARFLELWTAYRAGIVALAEGAAADPALGDAAFVSADRLGPRFEDIAWHSTTPFLSVLVAPGLDPRRLVVDPTASFFWFDCATASRNAAASLALPAAARAKVRRYTCLHRP